MSIIHFINGDDSKVWLAYTPRDRWGQSQCHLIQAPTAPAARRILREEFINASEYSLKLIDDDMHEIMWHHSPINITTKEV